MLFILKKVVSQFFLPLSLVSILMIAGLTLLVATRRKNAGKILLTLGTILLLAASYGFVADRLAGPLENRYPPLIDVRNINNYKSIKWIVVLGGGSRPDLRLPPSSRLTPSSLSRLLEAVRLHRNLPGTRLILSGGAVFQDVPEGEMLAKTAMLMGVAENALVMENKSLDTADQARLISKIVGPDPFILVTSAIHIPRSMSLFRKFGTNPIAAPTDYFVFKRTHIPPEVFFPGAHSLIKTEAAIHEYMGLIWMGVQ
jgi:uncharacterized SAM-binding protein YcdF (DUF218 family)